MSNESVTTARLATTRRRQYGLLAIVLLNLATATAMDALAWLHNGLVCNVCISSGIVQGQATVLGALAALVPRRAVVGLTGIGCYTIVFGCAMWLVHVAQFTIAIPSSVHFMDYRNTRRTPAGFC